MTRARRRVALVLLVVLMAAVYGLFIATPNGPRSLRAFDPDRTAELELDIWRAYYSGRNVRLFADLVTLNHEQYRFTWAVRAGRLRDEGGEGANWPEVGRLLQESYRALHAAVQ